MKTTPKIIALLPMKANSERVKNKNFRNFNGKPLFRWILDTLLSIPAINRVVINTDARDRLMQAGLKEGERLLIRNRRTDLCGDHISMNLIIADDLKHSPSDIYVMTHTTNPLLSAVTIKEALHQFMTAKEQGQCDSLFTVNRVQTRFYRKDGSAVNHDPNQLMRTQDLEPWFEENSNLYIFTRDSFDKTCARIGKKPYLYETPRFESIDIDDQHDWDFAEIATRLLIEKEGICC